MVSYTHCGEMPSLIGKLFRVDYLGYKMENSAYQTELLGPSYQSVAENLQVDPSVCRIVLT